MSTVDRTAVISTLALVVTLAVICILALTSVRGPPLRWSREPSSAVLRKDTQAAAAADGCYHVYVDVGTNIGVQIHKLFNASLFPGAKILPKYDQYFGPGDRSDVCAFGFEPNKNHVAILSKAERHYRALGRRLTYFQAAAGVKDGWGVFRSDKSFKNYEWGGRVDMQDDAGGTGSHPSSAKGAVDGLVRIVSIPDWMDTNVLARRIPERTNAARPPATVMKIDAEGTDELILAGLFSRGFLCAIDYLYVEHVDRAVLAFLMRSLKDSKCKTVVEKMDDETHRHFIMREE